MTRSVQHCRLLEQTDYVLLLLAQTRTSKWRCALVARWRTHPLLSQAICFRGKHNERRVFRSLSSYVLYNTGRFNYLTHIMQHMIALHWILEPLLHLLSLLLCLHFPSVWKDRNDTFSSIFLIAGTLFDYLTSTPPETEETVHNNNNNFFFLVIYHLISPFIRNL